MTKSSFESFRTSLDDKTVPHGISCALKGLWHDANGDWNTAHRVIQAGDSEEDAWVHAYLHRKEGDIDNAHYWYRRCNRQPAIEPLENEWATIAVALLEKDTDGRST